VPRKHHIGPGYLEAWRLAAAALIVLGAAGHAAASSIGISGATSGCFGAACSTFVATTSDATFGLTFSSQDPFLATTDASGSAPDFEVGSFQRGNVNVSDALTPLPFTLEVVFTLPAGSAGSSPVSALISGTNFGGGGALALDFDNTWQLISFADVLGSGSFEFSVSDLSVNKNGTSPIRASIRNAVFVPALQEDVQSATVPEPATLTLFGTALLMVGRRMRRSARAVHSA
jgi:hypothetical protein